MLLSKLLSSPSARALRKSFGGILVAHVIAKIIDGRTREKGFLMYEGLKVNFKRCYRVFQLEVV
jgi:hypothetical protein